MGAAILDQKSWGPPSLTGSDVKSAKVAPILLVREQWIQMTGALREQWIQMTGALVRIIARIGFITPGRLCSQTRIGNVSGYRCVSDCRSRGREFDPDPVPYFRGD